jgi:hypothetical protein
VAESGSSRRQHRGQSALLDMFDEMVLSVLSGRMSGIGARWALAQVLLVTDTGRGGSVHQQKLPGRLQRGSIRGCRGEAGSTPPRTGGEFIGRLAQRRASPWDDQATGHRSRVGCDPSGPSSCLQIDEVEHAITHVSRSSPLATRRGSDRAKGP